MIGSGASLKGGFISWSTIATAAPSRALRCLQEALIFPGLNPHPKFQSINRATGGTNRRWPIPPAIRYLPKRRTGCYALVSVVLAVKTARRQVGAHQTTFVRSRDTCYLERASTSSVAVGSVGRFHHPRRPFSRSTGFSKAK